MLMVHSEMIIVDVILLSAAVASYQTEKSRRDTSLLRCFASLPEENIDG